jgi:hypothetical protein
MPIYLYTLFPAKFKSLPKGNLLERLKIVFRIPIKKVHQAELRKQTQVKVELQKELQRALDRRQRRHRSQSVSSTSRERQVSPDKFPRHTHPRRPSSRLHQLHQLPDSIPPPPPAPILQFRDENPMSSMKKRAKLDNKNPGISDAKPQLKLDLAASPAASATLPPPEEFGNNGHSPKHTCGRGHGSHGTSSNITRALPILDVTSPLRGQNQQEQLQRDRLELLGTKKLNFSRRHELGSIYV